MVAPVSELLMTAEEFFRLPDPREGGKMELVAGKVVMHMPVSGGHGKRAAILARKLGNFVEDHPQGTVYVETGFRVFRNPDTVLAPDVSFVSLAMMPPGGIPDAGYAPCVPTLAVEVVSPDDTDHEVADKVDMYLRAGVPRVWVVRNRGATVTVFRAGGDAHIYGMGDTLTSGDAGFDRDGFALPLSVLFA